MSKLNASYIPLTFIKSEKELINQILNTLLLKEIYVKNNDIRKIGSLLNSSQYGFTAAKMANGNCKLLRITDIQGGAVDWKTVPFCDCPEEEKYQLNEGDILVARTGGTTGKSFLIKKPEKNAIFASYLIRLRVSEILLPEYLYLFMNSYYYWSQISDKKRGSAQPNVNAEKLKEIIIPYCGISEQKRIISLSNENDIISDSSDTKKVLKQYFSKNEVSNTINSDLELISKLRQTILQEAVRGKLVPQNQNDEPASELLKKIKAEKEKLEKQNKLLSLLKEEIPYELPKGWVWCKLGQLAIPQAGFAFDSDYFNKQNIGLPIIRIRDIESKETVVFYSGHFRKEFIVSQGDHLISMDGEFRVSIWKGQPALLNQRVTRLKYFSNYLLPKYLYYAIGPLLKKLNGTKSYTTVDHLSTKQIENIMIPFPPLNEQKRIVEKVDQLMKFCDELEEKVKDNQKYSEQLMEVVLKEAFET